MRKKLLLGFCAMAFFAMSSFAQTVVKGKVSGADGAPVSGASVKVVGSTSGTSTAADGTFSLSVSDLNRTLEITSVGFERLTVRAGSNLSNLQL
ncbi:MAG: CarboxypepD reg-like domain, partial [Bacteroidota bacterium]